MAIQSMVEMMEKEFRERLRTASYDDLTAYAEFINPEEYPAPHHIYMCDRLMAAERGDLMRVAISFPPGAAKSTYCSRLFPSWYLGRNSRKKFIQAGHTQNFVESEFGKKTRDIIQLPEYREVFPEVMVSSDSRSAGRWNLNNPRGGYICKGVGQAIAGFRGNISVVDDPIGSREDAESPTVRDKVFNWFSADLTTRLLPYSPLFIVATRWHSDDLIGRIEDMTKEERGIPYEIINIPALCEEENDPLGRAPGDHLWPEFYPISHYLALKSTLPARDWNSLYQGEPMDTTGGSVSDSWFKRYSGDPRKDNEVRRIVVSVDTASKAKERNDFTAILVWAAMSNGTHYLLDVLRKKMEFTQMQEAIEKTAKRWEANVILVEDKGSGTQYIQTRQGKAPAPIIPIPVNNADSKEFRFDAVTPMFEAGRVYLPDRAIWLPDYEKELLAFPMGKYDDQVDATSQYLDWARKRGRKKGGTKKVTTTSAGDQNSRVAAVERALEKMMEERRLKAERESNLNGKG